MVGVGVRLGVDVGSLGGCLDGVCVVSVDGVGSYQASIALPLKLGLYYVPGAGMPDD